MRIMAGRKRHSAEDIVRKLRRADELAAEGKTGEEIAADLRGVGGHLVQLAPPVRRHGWRRDEGIPKSCASRIAVSSGYWLTRSWRRTRCGRSPRENSEPNSPNVPPSTCSRT